MRHGCPEDRHHRISNELVDVTLVLEDNAGKLFQDLLDQPRQLLRIERLAQRRVTSEVGKENCDLPAFPFDVADRHHLVSQFLGDVAMQAAQ